eukprot:4610899-Pleurochrysis_carterae.AAC.1
MVLLDSASPLVSMNPNLLDNKVSHLNCWLLHASGTKSKGLAIPRGPPNSFMQTGVPLSGDKSVTDDLIKLSKFTALRRTRACLSSSP